jgi:hypothetical protein
MKFLKSLLGKNQDRDEAPDWNIRPPSERPPARRGGALPVANAGNANSADKAAANKEKKAPDPFLDDPMLDTMSLEVDLLSDEDNPYSTHSWAKDPENETRKLKTIQIGAKTEKSAAADFNPYDTGKMRKTWKR